MKAIQEDLIRSDLHQSANSTITLLQNKKLVERLITCTIYDCEFDCYVNGVIDSNIVYAIANDGSYEPAKDAICEYADYGMVQFYIGNYYEYLDISDKDNNAIWGYFHYKTGEIVIQPEYEYAGAFYGDRACIIKNGKIGYIDYTGNIVIDIIWDEIKCGKPHWKFQNGEHIAEEEQWLVRKDDKWGYINRDGKIIIPLDFDYATLFHENRAEVKIGKKFGCINVNGDIVIKPVYDEIEEFKFVGKDDIKSYYAARVKNDGKYGFINEDGKHIIECLFEEAFEFWDIGYAGVKFIDKWSIIDKNGNFVAYDKFEDIGQLYGVLDVIYAKKMWGTNKEGYYQHTLGSYNISDVYFTVKVDNKWGISDSNFNIIMPELNNQYIKLKGKKLYIKNGDVTSIKKIKP